MSCRLWWASFCSGSSFTAAWKALLGVLEPAEAEERDAEAVLEVGVVRVELVAATNSSSALSRSCARASASP